ncbi:hypothetical protein E2986_09057 [Frieseomelitta varia]|uniref:Methyltransferase type 12 domain-containing protein n=1 Tax=Frieseomelitta varia TaxID=561572 RepID=A0A833RWA4_9HYME|nr:hypothetical protein E2986_09057 [Frieseomelitta varia]
MESAEEYVNSSTSQYRDALDFVEEFKKEMSEMKGRCIDIGCGPGDVSKELILPKLSPDAELVGADISKEMIDHAREKYQNEERLSFIELDIEASILPEDELELYSNVLSFYCIHWCENPRQAFDNIYKLLQPDGKALVMFLAWNNGFDAYVKVYENPKYKVYMQDLSHFVPFFHRCEDSQATLRLMLEDIGFEIIDCSRREKSFVYHNMDMLKRILQSISDNRDLFPVR